MYNIYIYAVNSWHSHGSAACGNTEGALQTAVKHMKLLIDMYYFLPEISCFYFPHN